MDASSSLSSQSEPACCSQLDYEKEFNEMDRRYKEAIRPEKRLLLGVTYQLKGFTITAGLSKARNCIPAVHLVKNVEDEKRRISFSMGEWSKLIEKLRWAAEFHFSRKTTISKIFTEERGSVVFHTWPLDAEENLTLGISTYGQTKTVTLRNMYGIEIILEKGDAISILKKNPSLKKVLARLSNVNFREKHCPKPQKALHKISESVVKTKKTTHKPLREKGLKRFWSAVKYSNNSSSGEQGLEDLPEDIKSNKNALPLLQVWPSADSPRGEADGQSFVFPNCAEDALSQHSNCETYNQNDSGIDSTQISPSPLACGSVSSPLQSPTPSFRRPSSTLLHPDHARFLHLHPLSSSDHSSMEDICDIQNGLVTSTSSSTTSSLTSVAAVVTSTGSRASDSCDSRRRSSNISARYSLFDALDLEYALLRAAARGSVGPYSLSESLHKLTFTQSLAFPALARGLASKNRYPHNTHRSRPLRRTDSGLNGFAKIITALVLVLVSVLVFAVVYKFVRT